MSYNLKRIRLFVVLISGISASAFAAEHTKDSLATVKKNIEQKKAILVDVREKSEWDEGHIAGAVLLPLGDLNGGLGADDVRKKLPKGRIVYTHCVVGKRSLTAADILKRHGYEVRALKQGYDELLDAGFENADE